MKRVFKYWLAVDKSGENWLFKEKPRRVGDEWLGDECTCLLGSLTNGLTKWEDEPKQITITVED